MTAVRRLEGCKFHYFMFIAADSCDPDDWVLTSVETNKVKKFLCLWTRLGFAAIIFVQVR
jgi:hypothetical protein